MGFGVFDDVVDGFLGDAKAFGLNQRIQAAFEGIGADLGFETSQGCLTLQVPTQGRFQAQIIGTAYQPRRYCLPW